MRNSREIYDELKKTRDELRVQAHLFKAEAKDQWEELEEKWNEARRDMAPALKAAKEASGNVGEANRLLLNEIKEGYKKIRERMH